MVKLLWKTWGLASGTAKKEKPRNKAGPQSLGGQEAQSVWNEGKAAGEWHLGHSGSLTKAGPLGPGAALEALPPGSPWGLGLNRGMYIIQLDLERAGFPQRNPTDFPKEGLQTLEGNSCLRAWDILEPQWTQLCLWPLPCTPKAEWGSNSVPAELKIFL